MPPDPSPGASQEHIAAALRKGGEIAGVNDGRGRPAGDRFKVYRNNVVVSLREALAATFPATERLMGAAFFEAAATAYARTNKPASPLLFRYGGTFPDFLATLPGLAAYPFVPEAARIEYARVQAYHAADAAPLAQDALAAVPPDDLARVVLDPHPATHVLELPHGGLAAWQTNASPPLAATPAPAAVVSRPAMDILVTPLDAPAAAFAQSLAGGTPLGGAADVEALDVAAALASLLSAGAFRALRMADA